MVEVAVKDGCGSDGGGVRSEKWLLGARRKSMTSGLYGMLYVKHGDTGGDGRPSSKRWQGV